MSGPFRYAGLWQWNPVSCVGPRSYDERWMMAHNGWFFDRAFMARYFDAMLNAGLNTWVLANTHPFPFMVELRQYPDARVLTDSELARYQAQYHWLFETARARNIKPFVLFHTCYVSDAFGLKHQILPGHSYEPSPLACDYTRHCVRKLCETYPELEGINAEASENVAREMRAEFANRAIIAGIREAGRRPVLFFRGWISDPVAMKAKVLDAYDGECFFTVKYTWEFLVHRKPDPEFLRWVNVCGPSAVLPEFWISNYQPFGCHDVDLARDLREAIWELGCPGFTSHPMDLYGAPFVQGGPAGALQLDRDRDWYAALSGQWKDGALAQAQRFNLKDVSALCGAVVAACRPGQKISYYLTGNKQNFLQPQWLARVGGKPRRGAELQTLDFWKALPEQVDKSYGRWMSQIEAIRTRFPNESEGEFALPDLIAELDDLDRRWHPLPDTAPREAETYAMWMKDVTAQRWMARAWTERARAIAAHYAGQSEAVFPALESSLALVRRTPETLGFDGPYRILVGRHTLILSWSSLIAALEQELADWCRDAPAAIYPIGTADYYETLGQDFAVVGS